jgi:hypothetical protein
MVIVGGGAIAFKTVTVIETVVLFLDVSRATAEREYDPFATVLVFHTIL